MKKLLLLTMAASLLGFAGCKKTEPEVAPEAAQGETKVEAKAGYDCAPVTVESLVALSKDGKVVSEDEMYQILEAYQCCTVKEKDLTIDGKCPAKQAEAQLKKDKKQIPKTKALGEKLAAHPNNVVRGYLAGNYKLYMGGKPDDIKQAMKIFADEKDPFVIKSLLHNLSSDGGSVPELGQFMIAQSKSENPVVRMQAAMDLASPHSKGVEGAVDRCIELLDDPDKGIASRVCSDIGRLGDEKVVEPIVKILSDESKNNIHGGCINGLAWLWLDYPNHANTSEAAYKATLDYLKTTPRTKDIPSWVAFQAFVPLNEDKIGDWKTRATYYKAPEFVSVLVDVVKDPNANWMARSNALKAIAAHGTKADLTALQDVIAKDKDSKLLTKPLEDALKDAK